MADRLANQDVNAIYSSPLRRALATAEAIARPINERLMAAGQAPLAVAATPDLSEIDHGAWSGKTEAEVRAEWPDLLAQWLAAPATVRMPGGESLSDVRARALRFLDQSRHRHPEGNIVVVTHGTVERLLVASFLDLEVGRIWTIESHNGALSIVEDYDVPLLMAVNDDCHLDGVRSRTDAQVR